MFWVEVGAWEMGIRICVEFLVLFWGRFGVVYFLSVLESVLLSLSCLLCLLVRTR